MITPIDKDEVKTTAERGPTVGRKPANAGVSAHLISPPSRILTEAARLRTETSYKAGSGRRVSTTPRSRSHARLLTGELRLVVNQEKSHVVTSVELEFLSFAFVKSRATINVTTKCHPQVQAAHSRDHWP